MGDVDLHDGLLYERYAIRNRSLCVSARGNSALPCCCWGLQLVTSPRLHCMLTEGARTSRMHRKKAIPYVAAALLWIVVLSVLIDNLPTGLGSVPHRRLSAALKGESCEDSHLNSWEAENSALAVGLYTPVIVYMFLGLAVVCDDFFTESIEVICEELELTEDVAGATFMAAGGSAPELFTSLLTVVTTQSSAGVGTILGSAVFNLVVIISLSCLVTEGDLVRIAAPF